MRKLDWREKFLALFVGTLVALWLVEVFYGIPTARAMEIELIERRQEEVVRSIARGLDVDLLRVKDTLSRIAERPEFRTMGLDAQKKTMTQQVEISALLSSLSVMDADGTFVTSTRALPSDYATQSYADRPFFAVPFEQGQTYFSPTISYSSRPDLVLTSVGVPIVSDDGERRGVLVGTMRLHALIDRVASYPLDEGTVAYVVDSKGLVVAHSGMDLSALADGPLSLDYSDRPEVQKIMGGDAPWSHEYTHGDIPYYGSYSILESNGWGVIVETPLSSIRAQTSALVKRLLSIEMAIFLAALVATLVFTRQISAKQVRAEQEIHRLSQFQQSVIDNANVWLDVLDRDANVLIWNKAAEKISGYSREEVVGSGKIWSWLYPDAAYREEITAKAAAIIEQGEDMEDFRTTIRRKDGQSRIISWNSQNLLDDKGSPVGSIALGRDITEYMQTEEALRTKDNAIASSISAIAIADLEGILTYVNSSFVKMWGYDDDKELLGRDVVEFWRTEEEAQEVLESVREEGRWLGEMVAKRKDGSPFDAQLIANLATDETGRPVCMMASFIDITERKRVQEALRNSEEEKAAILNSITTNIAFVNRDLEILWANKAAADSAGKSPEEMVGCKCYALWADPEKPCEGCPTIRAFETKRSQRAVITTPDGRVWSERGEPILDTHGDLLGVVEVAHDITESVHHEERLRQAARMETAGRIAGGIAHNFNNLLTVINGYSDLLLLTVGPEHPLYDDIREVRKAGTRAAELTSQLLTFSRHQKQQVQVLDLNDLVRGVTKNLLNLVKEHTILDIRTSEEKEYVEADAGQIEDAIINLVVNARDAMPQGGVLTIEVNGVELDEQFVAEHPDAEMGQYVMLVVSDTGVGMTPEIMEHLFEPFFTTKEVGKGTGLGLASVYGTVKQSNGNIYVDSEPGRGTTFRIYWPRAEEISETHGSEWQKEGLPTGRETILVIEDSDQVRKLVVRMLHRLGYTVLEASQGSVALDLCLARTEPIDLLLVDVVMPEVGGQEIIDRLRRECAMAKESLILYVSGYPEGIIDANVHLGSRPPLLRKPFSIEALAEAVRQTLDRTNGG